MPNIDESTKAWELELSGRFGDAVKRRRKALGLTAVQLADLTSRFGYPVTRVAITKIETNKRAGKIDVAEWLVLAEALEIPPVLLLYPDYPDGVVQRFPKINPEPSWIAGQRMSGMVAGGVVLVSPEGEELRPFADVGLVARVQVREHMERELTTLNRKLLEQPQDASADEGEALRSRIQRLEDQLELLASDDIPYLQARLWGGTEVGSDE